MDYDKIVRIGCASEFLGDSVPVALPLVWRARIDALVFDDLSDVTMSIVARARSCDPSGGYAGDFVTVVTAEIIKDVAGRGERQWGGDLEACRDAIGRLADEAVVSEYFRHQVECPVTRFEVPAALARASVPVQSSQEVTKRSTPNPVVISATPAMVIQKCSGR